MERTLAIIAIVGFVTCISTACTPLPDVPKIAAEAPADKAPDILTSKGTLSPEKSREIMRRLQRQAKPTDLLQRQNAVMEVVTGAPLVGGNKVTLLADGRSSYDAIFRAIANARETINLEEYKIEDDEMGKKMAELLLSKRSEGVQVNLMYDKFGSFSTPASFFGRLREAGVQVAEISDPPHADHRKMLIVDGRLAITGGINISQVYASTPLQRHKHENPPVPWRDTDIQIEGPVAAEFQKMFVNLWAAVKGAELRGPRYFPTLREEGNVLVRAIGSTPGKSNRITYVSYVAAIVFAEHSIHLTNAYFIPDDRTLDALAGAAKRGVDVKIIVPSVTDSSLALYAMRYNFSELLKAGVKVYQRRRALLHAKTAVIDGVWSTVGSTNLDFLSLSNNYEVNAVVLSPEFAAQMENMFQKDLAESERIDPRKWERRSVWEKMREFWAHTVSHII